MVGSAQVAFHTTKLPVADISLLGTERQQELMDVWDFAFSTYGFVLMVNHGLDEKYVTFEKECQAFFKHSLENKMKCSAGKQYGHGGYAPQGVESVSASGGNKKVRPADAVENICANHGDFRYFPGKTAGKDITQYHADKGPLLSEIKDDVFPDCQFRREGEELYFELRKILLDVMRLSALVLNIDENFFYEKGGYDKPNAIIRVSHYLETDNKIRKPQDESEMQLRYGEHTDYTGFTLLWRNQTNGLQCRNPFYKKTDEEVKTMLKGRAADVSTENEWIDILVDEQHPHTLVVNAGDLLHRWTNDYFVSNLHRVVDVDSDPRFASEVKKSEGKEPISVVFFTGPDDDTICETVPSDKIPQEKKYEPVLTRDYLWKKVNNSRV